MGPVLESQPHTVVRCSSLAWQIETASLTHSHGGTPRSLWNVYHCSPLGERRVDTILSYSMPLQVTSSPCAENTGGCAAPVRLGWCCECCSPGTEVVGSPSLDMFQTCLDKALSSLTQLWSANLLRG